MLQWNWKPSLLLIVMSVLAVCGLTAQKRVPTAETSAVADAPKPVNRNGKWGYTNSTGQFVIKPKYFAAEPFNLRYCGSPTLRTSSAKRGSERRGSSKKSVFNPSSDESRS
jgi:hypothetical protein